jgi:hypothetical protein
MTSSTSLIISGSSAEVGSSNSMQIGSMAQRAGDGHALLLAAGELPRVLVRVLLEADAVEQFQPRSHGLVPASSQHLDLGDRQVLR